MKKFGPALYCYSNAIFFRSACFLFILFIGAGFINKAYAQGPGPAWEYSKDILIAGAGTPVADYQIQVILTAGQYTGMNADGSDLRFYVGNTACNFWVEKWNNTGQSVIWVKVPAANTTVVTMYYGNDAASSAVSPGTDVFDFFDDFISWNSSVWDAKVTVSSSVVTVQEQDGGYLSNRDPFPIVAGSSYFLEAKHNEGSYYRVRYYATTTTGGNGSNEAITGLPTDKDYGYFSPEGSGDNNNSPTAEVFWQGNRQPLNILNAGTDYITQWQITDGTHFKWSTLKSDYTPAVASNYLSSVTSIFRYITITATEGTASTAVDWIRVRKSAGSDAAGISIDPVITWSSQVQTVPTITGFTQSSVCAGGSVTTVITGTNFDNTSNVTFNGVDPQSFHVDSRTQITATSKPGVTAGLIVVTTPGGAATSPNNLIINPLPSLFSVLGGGNYCSAGGATGLPITLSGSESGVSYQLFKGATMQGSPMTGTGNGLDFGLQTGDASFTIVATNNTTGCSQQMTGAPTVVIDPLPTAYNVTGTGSFCSGGTGLTVGLSGSQAGVNYQLYLGATAVGTVKSGTGAALSFGNQTVAGTYTVKATRVSPATGCTNGMTGSAEVTVNLIPTGTIAVTETSGTTPDDGKICVSDPITFTAPPGYSSYTFKLNGTPVSPQPGTNVYTTSALTGNPTITVEVIDANTCHGTFSTSVAVSVSTLPTGPFAPSVNNVCPGSTVTFNAPTGYSNYVFKVNGGSAVNRGSLSSYSYTTLADGDFVSVDVTNSNGCVKTFTAVAMVIKPLPDAAGAITGTAELCAGTNSVAYNVAAISNATSYIWTLPTGATGSSTGSSITVNFSNAATTGNITVAGVNGCATGVASSLQVIVNPLPTLQITDPAPVCFPSTVDLAVGSVTSGSTTGLSLTYFKDAAGTVSLPSPNAVAVSGTYYIKGTTVNGCADIIKPVVVIVNSLPTLQITDPAPVCSSNSVDLTASAVTAGSTAGLTFTYFTDAAGTNALASPNAVTAPGTYYIKGTSTSGCSDVIKPVTVTINPLPTAGIANDANTAECLNSLTKPGVVFTGAGGTTPYTFTYTVDGDTKTVTTVSGNSVTVYQPTTTAGTFHYTLVSVKDNSSTHCENAQNGSVDVTINALPVPVLSGPDQICPDQQLSYSTETGNGIHNYVWTYTNGSLVSGGTSTDNTIEIHWANNTSAKSIYVNYTDAKGCTGNTSVSVISTLPTKPTFLTSGPNDVCLNSTSKTYEVQSGYTDYVWDITGGTITSGGGTNDYKATVIWNASGPQSISVNFNSGTCSAPAPTAYPVTVNTLPTATVTTNNAAVCQNGTSPIITFTGADGAANYTFSYTINGVAQADIVSSGNSKTVTLETPLTPGDYIYKLTNVADNITCSQVQTNAVTVTVHPLPTATISGTTTVCKDAVSPEITFTGSNGTAPYTFTYKIGTGSNQTVITSSGNSVTIPALTGTAGTYDYNLVSVKDANGCEQTITETATITVNPLPTATMTGPTALCLNDAGNITFTGGNGTAPYRFTYTIDGGANQTITTISGNSVTVPVTTSSAHTFTYQLISVQDNSSTACVQNQAGTVTVIVSAVSVGGTATGDATVCTGTNTGTVTLDDDKVGNVIRWESSVDGGTIWNTVTPNNTGTSLTYTNLTATTQYRAVVQSGTCTEAPSNAVTITVNTANGGIVDHGPSGTGTVCAGETGSVILTGNSGPVLRWEYSTDGGTNWIIDGKTDAFYNFTNITQTTWYRAYSQATGCDAIYSTAYKVTVNPRPGATIDASPNPICIGGSTTLTLNLTGSGAMAGTVTETDGTNTITNNYPFSGTSANPVVLTGITPATSSTYTISTLADANCPARVADLPNYATITVNPLPAPVVITPGNTTICSGTVLPLSSVENHSGNFSPKWTSSPNVDIPDYDPTGVSNTITVPAGTIPVGGVVDSIDVVLNVQHPEVNDLLINLGAPNGKVITLVSSSLSGPNLTGTTVSSRTTQYPVITTGSTPYNGKYSAEGDNPYGAEAGNANTRKFTDLFGTTLDPPNGDWTIYLADTWADNIGTLQDWALTIYYHVPVNPVDIVWSPLDSLFTDPSATIPYIGDARQTVYAKPSADIIYTGKAEANTCTTASDVKITVTPAPEVNIVPEYCAVPNKVRLTASSIPAASSYIWNTGETTSVIDVDEAKLYTVAATTGLHCVGTGFLSIAQELVKNGDFEAGNSGFYTQYGYVAPPGNQTGVGSLHDEGLYAVDSNAHNYHDNFFGKDHTAPGKTGKFMMLNGAPGTGIIWQETVPVLPNTNYYYSAWAMNLNNQSPFAVLQFSVNGVPIGSLATNGIADLSKAPQPAGTEDVNINNWVRFYYGATDGWYSGTATTAVIQIIDLNTDRNGNDFGLDDISFATLSTFITLTSAPGTDVQSVCRGDKITDISYKVGSGGTPTVTGLPNGVTAEFKNGITLIISGTPNDISGVYNYTITTTGACSNPTTATGQITVKGQKVTLSSPVGTDGQEVCKGKPIASIRYTLSESATDAEVTGLPTGVIASAVSGNVITISGSPVDSGTFTYKIKTIGSSCNADSLTGTIRSNVQTIVKTSGDDNQKLCINNDISDVVYKIGGAGTGAIVSGLPTGVTGNYAGGTYTISGKPTVSGVFDYTITTAGTCDAAAITGKITVFPDATVNLNAGSNATQVKCFNTPIDNITYTTTGAPDASVKVTGLPSGVDYTISGGIVSITGTPTESGVFTYTVTATGSCVEASVDGTITIDPLVNTGTSFTANYTGSCGTASGTLQLNGFAGIIKDWEFSTDGGATWNTAPTTTGVFDFTVPSTTYFRVVFDGGACGDAYSNPYAIGVHNLWTGEVSDNWNDVNNWSDGNLPSTSCPDVIIPQVTSNNYPVLASGTAIITNLIIKPGALVTVNGSSKLQIGGDITNAGTFDATAGTIEFNGTSAQTIDGQIFKDRTIQNLIVSNANTLSVASTPGDTLKISGDLTFGTADGKLNTGDNITLLSTASATADVGVLPAANSITGDVIVERYLAALNNWEFVAIPTKTQQTINEAWQEGQTHGNVGPIGYGTNITGPVFANGLDFQSPNASMKYWDNISEAFVNINETDITFPVIQNGYFLYVRGDRQATADLSTPHIPTVIRTKGALNTGPVNLDIPANNYYSLGNPYASRVDFRKIAGIGNVASTFYVWDPMMSGYYSVGGYQTLSAVTSYWPSTPSTYYLDKISYPYLESGQAVFVNNGGNSGIRLTFNETAKVTGSRLIFRSEESSPNEFIRTFLCTSSGRVIDGNAVAFSSRYKNGIDVNDAIKIKNPGENLGLRTAGVIFAIEARAPVSSIDTVYFDLANLVKETYQFRFNPDNMEKEDLKAYLIDNYLKTTTDVSLSGITSINFTVNSDAASYATDRFMVVFKRSTSAPPVMQTPFTFVSLTANEANKDILVVWNVKNENNLLDYEVEKSVDGINFVKKETVNATNNGVTSYQRTDNQALPGDNYYRIRSVDKNGKIVYSTVVKVAISNLKTGISIYPNPITDAVIHLQFINQPQGKYGIRLLDPLGQLILVKQIEYAGGNGSEDIKWDYKMARGMYQLEIIKPDQSVHIIKVLY